jgi:hypothetical protein
VASAATSLRNPRSSLEKSTLTSLAPVFRSNPRTASASATHSVADDVHPARRVQHDTVFVPPAMNFSVSICPSGFIRLI